MFIAALFTIVKIWKQPKCPPVDKTTMGHLYYGILLSHKKEKFYPFWQQIDLEDIMVSEESQSEKNKYHMIAFTCGI